MKDLTQEMTRRKRAAVEEEARLVKHFGSEAHDCENWEQLFSVAWIAELADLNHSPHLPIGWAPYFFTKKQPKRLQRATPYQRRHGGSSITIHAANPSIYSDKFCFFFAQKVIQGETASLSLISPLLAHADAVTCIRLMDIVDDLAAYLYSSQPYWLQGTGRPPLLLPYNEERAKALFRNWSFNKPRNGLFICRYGLATLGSPVRPASLATRILKIMRGMITAKQQFLMNEQPIVVNAPATAMPLVDQVEMSGEDYESIRYQRELEAHAHDREIDTIPENTKTSLNASEAPSEGNSALPSSLQMPPATPPAVVAPAAQRKSKQVKPDLRDATINLDDYLTGGLTTTDCDSIGKAVGFHPPIKAPNGSLMLANKHVTYPPARLNAICDVLEDYIKSNVKTEFVLKLAERFGWPRPKARIDNTGGPAYERAKSEAEKDLEGILAERKSSSQNRPY